LLKRLLKHLLVVVVVAPLLAAFSSSVGQLLRQDWRLWQLVAWVVAVEVVAGVVLVTHPAATMASAAVTCNIIVPVITHVAVFCVHAALA
jgi:hypothetical protein